MAEITNNPHEPGKEGSHGQEGQVSHERRDVDVFQISAFGIGLLLACVVTVFAVWAMFDFLFKREDAKNVGNPDAAMLSERQKLPPEPRLQAVPRVELQDLRADEDAILTGYGWIDPNKHLVRIPIEEAMDLVAKRGLPYKASPAGSDNDGFRMIPEDSSSGRTLEKISQ
jgi:hypothetical protein